MSRRTAAQLVAGCIQQTKEANGKLLLTRALKVAHNTMTNYQLVAQVCFIWPSIWPFIWPSTWLLIAQLTSLCLDTP